MRVTMTHPQTKGTIDVPEAAVAIYERSGWKASGDETPASSAVAKGVKATAKEEGK
ncbi:hypothetical protein [Nonomuraea sp. NPDC050786]|uniref:hypothetical protein n=1 Tax=Nonomuraea sp. NPDC050786 TaxID=3154840 RepID=UPI00340A8D6F